MVKKMTNVDEEIFLWVNGGVGKLHLFDSVVGLLASDYLIPVALSLTLLAFWFSGRNPEDRCSHQISVFVALSALALSNLAVLIITIFYQRDRPFIKHEDIDLLFYKPTDHSFPSNSTSVVFAIAAGVWAVDKRLGATLFLAAGLHALARVYVGVHYPLDVITGALIGIVAVCMTLKLRDLLKPILVLVVKVARTFCLA